MTRMIEYSTVYGRFYSSAGPVSGIVFFSPQHRTVSIDGAVYSLRPLVAYVENGVLVHNGSEGISIPASTLGLTWAVRVVPLGYANMLQSYPGDIISLGD